MTGVNVESLARAEDGSRGERTRRAILEEAAAIAAAEGLEGLSIGRLAAELGMSKSGLFAHFGSKEDLQVATVEFVRNRSDREIVAVVEKRVPVAGLERLWGLADEYLTRVQHKATP
ncbi:MAG TPA: helix-turn-helix domain-containing protein, partial [Tepidiformaceae bacterium]|nr:helix-turn-helix domain-containing protein [Tepidiformaceae bacterium]